MRAISVAEETDALQQVARSNSAGRENDLFAGRKIFRAVDLLGVGDAHPLHAPLRFRILNYQTADHFAVETAHGGSRDYAFRSAADSHHGMDARAAHRRRDPRRKIP